MKKSIFLGAIFGFMSLPALANIEPCTSTHNGTVTDPVVNLHTSCKIDAVKNGGIGQADVTLLSNALTQGQPATAADVHSALSKLVVFVGGIADNGISAIPTTSIPTLIVKKGLDDYLNNGYSVLYVGLDNTALQPQVGIEDTAYALEEVIKFINANRNTDYGEMAVIGFSMGGLSARYALKNMENDGVEHKVGIYVSYDAPHKGANVPQAIQSIVPTMEQYLGLIQDQINNATNFMNQAGITAQLTIAKQDVNGILAKVRSDFAEYGSNIIASKLAKQMLMQHYAGSTEYDALQASLTTLGYPANTIKAAVTNGSVQGVGLPAPQLDSDGAFYQFFGKRGADVSKAYLGARFALYPTVAGSTNLSANFNWWFKRTGNFPWPWTQTYNGQIPRSRTTAANIVSYDQAPGSRGEVLEVVQSGPNSYLYADRTPGYFLDKATASFLRPKSTVVVKDHAPLNYTFSFIPSFSALDITVANPVQAIDVSQSPFDSVYVNGDKQSAVVEDNVSHHRMLWPVALKAQIDQATAPKPNAQEQTVIWLNRYSGDYTAMTNAVRAVFQVTGRMPRNLSALATDMAEYKQWKDGNANTTTAFASVDTLRNLFTPTPFDADPQKLVDMVNYVKTQDVLNGFTNAQCTADGNPASICAKVQ